MNIRKLSYTLLLAGCCLLAASCSGDDPSPVDPSPAKPVGSRASLSVKSRSGETTSNELINSWWIAFVDHNGTVSSIISRDASLSTAVEREEFNVELPDGTYTAYAFANITPQQLSDEAGVTFTVGQKVASDIMSKAWKLMPNNPDKSTFLPMSGFKEVTVSSSRTTPAIEIEVVRMLAKVEFTFSNRSQKAITVNSISFGPLATGAVGLLPDYSKLGDKPVLLSGLGSEDVAYSFPGEAAARTLAAGKDNGLTDYFYVRESDAANPATSGLFHIKVNITREGQAEELLYALTDELTYINRNDYVQIPITFTDYVFDVDVLFYPPIGGYPAVLTEKRDEEFHITFGTRGKFAVRPLIREAAEGSPYLMPDQFTVTATVVSDPANILKSPVLSYDPVAGELTGELTSATGRAEVKLQVTFSDGTAQRQYEKTVYIIRANK